MLILLFLYALNVVNPSEMACVGSIQDMTLPLDIYIAGVEMEGIVTLAVQGQILYLDGPQVSSLKPGAIQRVVRPVGRVRDPLTGDKAGFYYMDIGTIRIEAVERESATAHVLSTCHGMIKGDLVVPNVQKPSVEFDGKFSNNLTSIPDGLVSSILLGKDDIRELVTGNFCFIGLGGRDGIKPGDRFTVFRTRPKYNPQDMDAAGSNADKTYSPINNTEYRLNLNMILSKRKLPPQVLGDIIVVEVGDRVSTGKIINSMSEMHVGDLIVKR